MPDERPTRRLVHAALMGSFVDAIGTGTWISSAVVVFSRHAHVDSGSIGFGLTLSAIAGMLASVPIGAIADRIGPLRVFCASYFLRALGMMGWLAIDGHLPFLLYSATFGIIDRSAASLTRSLIIAPLDKDEAVRLMGRMALPSNIGFGVGALLSATVLAASLPLWIVLAINSTSFIVVALLYWAVLHSFDTSSAHVKQSALLAAISSPGSITNRDRLEATLQNFVLSFHRTLLTVFIPLELILLAPRETWIIPSVMIANASIVALSQSKVNEIATTGSYGLRFWYGTAIALAASMLLMALSWESPVALRSVLISMMIILQISAELIHSAALSVIFVKFSRADHLTQDLSAINVGGQLQNVVGPTIFASLISSHSPVVALCLATIFLAVGWRIARSPRWIRLLGTEG